MGLGVYDLVIVGRFLLYEIPYKVYLVWKIAVESNLDLKVPNRRFRL